MITLLRKGKPVYAPPARDFKSLRSTRRCSRLLALATPSLFLSGGITRGGKGKGLEALIKAMMAA